MTAERYMALRTGLIEVEQELRDLHAAVGKSGRDAFSVDTLQTIERELRRLKAEQDALEARAYGFCQEKGCLTSRREIGKTRLRILPFARSCERCEITRATQAQVKRAVRLRRQGMRLLQFG
jgi:RNA polymerase-binding transcription factor DksA